MSVQLYKKGTGKIGTFDPYSFQSILDTGEWCLTLAEAMRVEIISEGSEIVVETEEPENAIPEEAEEAEEETDAAEEAPEVISELTGLGDEEEPGELGESEGSEEPPAISF